MLSHYEVHAVKIFLGAITSKLGFKRLLLAGTNSHPIDSFAQ
ncbi:MAG: hypothetical protein ABL925_05120 [Methylococcales bacterium]